MSAETTGAKMPTDSQSFKVRALPIVLRFVKVVVGFSIGFLALVLLINEGVNSTYPLKKELSWFTTTGSAVLFVFATVGMLTLYSIGLPEKMEQRTRVVRVLIFASFCSFFTMVLGLKISTMLIADLHMDIEVRGADLIIRGAIGPEIVGFMNNLPAATIFDRLILDHNLGGSVLGTLTAARTLRDRGVSDVEIKGDCASACAYLALLFPHVLLEPGARLGFHDVRDISGRRDDENPERQALHDALIAAGHSDTFVNQALSTDKLHWMTAQELIAAGIPVDSPNR